ncbi:MAG: helix-turn-helix domain-containing protein [Thermomicrobiales bacterium]|nr:helix-turn-helix domain-containing protein [Thermomicrobiales bacterium]
MTNDMHGDRIRAIRHKLGLSQVQLAELLDVSNVTVNRWEKDRAQPHGGTIARLIHLEREADASPGRKARSQVGNLPRGLPVLVGRERDRKRLEEALSDAPLVTIVGTAGAGKTSLALNVATRGRLDWADGAWFVDLAAVSEPDAAPAAVAFALGLRDDGQVPLPVRLREAMQERSLLILLDNCEHVRAAAAALAQEMLTGGSTSRIVATSRVALGIPGERVLPLRPLPLADAAQLFLQRAREHQPDLPALDAESAQAIETICLRLDGLPLALELAAARARILSIIQIASRLDQRFTFLQIASETVERHRTLQAAIAWSYDLLRPEAARLFRAMGVFTGWFDLAALERVSGSADALELVDELVQHSLVIVEHTGAPVQARYRLLESLAEFARHHLRANDEFAEAAGRHASTFQQRARDLSQNLRGARQAALLTSLDRDQDNMLLALDWLLTSGDVTGACALAAELGPYWQLRGRYEAGRNLLSRVVDQPGAAAAPDYHRALRQLGTLKYVTGYLLAATETLSEAVAASRNSGDDENLARALDMFGLVQAGRRAFVEAQAAHSEARALALATGDRAQAALSTMHLGQLANVRGGNSAAERAYREAWSLVQGSGDLTAEAVILSNLGEVAARLGRYERALGYYRRSREILLPLGFADRIAASGVNIAEVLLILGDSAAAAPMSEDSVEQFRRLGNRANLAAATYILAAARAAEGRLVDALCAGRESLAIYHQLNDWIDIADTIELVARILLAGGAAETAARLLAGVERLREQDAIARYPLFDIAAAEADLARSLSPAQRAASKAEGRELARHDLVAEALHVGDVRDGEPLSVLVRHQPGTQLRKDEALTPRQVEILRLVASGLSNREIGGELGISARTVDRHLTAIFAVLDVDRRSAAVARATALGLLTGPGL